MWTDRKWKIVSYAIFAQTNRNVQRYDGKYKQYLHITFYQSSGRKSTCDTYTLLRIHQRMSSHEHGKEPMALLCGDFKLNVTIPLDRYMEL